MYIPTAAAFGGMCIGLGLRWRILIHFGSFRSRITFFLKSASYFGYISTYQITFCMIDQDIYFRAWLASICLFDTPPLALPADRWDLLRHAHHHGGFFGRHRFWHRYSAGSRPEKRFFLGFGMVWTTKIPVNNQLGRIFFYGSLRGCWTTYASSQSWCVGKW